MDRNLVGCINRAVNIVALRKESVDRNLGLREIMHKKQKVALRKESVDRNFWRNCNEKIIRVALRKESVDRNLLDH